jgi:hypothetical protein
MDGSLDSICTLHLPVEAVVAPQNLCCCREKNDLVTIVVIVGDPGECTSSDRQIRGFSFLFPPKGISLPPFHQSIQQLLWILDQTSDQ